MVGKNTPSKAASPLLRNMRELGEGNIDEKNSSGSKRQLETYDRLQSLSPN